MINYNHQRLLLRQLIELKNPLKNLAGALQHLEWDIPEELVSLEKTNLIDVLNRFIHSQLERETIEEWANFIESREDISYTLLIKDIIYELANPELTEEITKRRALELIEKLENDL